MFNECAGLDFAESVLIIFSCVVPIFGLCRQEAHDRVSALSKRLEEVTTQCSTLTRTNEEVEEKCIVMKRSLSGKEESCEALQQKVAVLLKADKVHSTSHRTKVSGTCYTYMWKY